ncbi:hypothetical protein [Psychrobacillus psychrodurans]|uniref:Uncharacterized protein n=1 Tax=Psychrobacillus psychrodurans TaxID=126157 RepID=A0A9X3LFG8_9BACI|nr:hypothetical protein [Psychrobacillus psychrodurans]MCZ8535374.1 hypothetical protein [Psychrobacillus psychrodurans]
MGLLQEGLTQKGEKSSPSEGIDEVMDPFEQVCRESCVPDKALDETAK